MKLCVPIAPSLKALCNTNTSPPTQICMEQAERFCSCLPKLSALPPGVFGDHGQAAKLQLLSLLSQHRSRLRNTTSSSYFNQGEEPRGITKAPLFRLNSQLPFHHFISFPQARRFTRCPSSRGAGEMGLCEARLLPCTWPRWHLTAERAHCQPAAGGFICTT